MFSNLFYPQRIIITRPVGKHPNMEMVVDQVAKFYRVSFVVWGFSESLFYLVISEDYVTTLPTPNTLLTLSNYTSMC